MTNNLSILLFLAVLPIIVILIYVNSRDKNKEPLALLIRLFIGGILSCGMVLMISGLISSINPALSPTNNNKTLIEMIIYAFVSVALVEELCKWIIVYLFGYNNREFDEMYDGLVYAVFVSLGFAFIENILYVLVSNSINTAIIRALCAIPSHACDAIFMGYHMSIAREYKLKKNKKQERKQLLLSIIMPTILHGIYDFCLMAGYNYLVLVFIVFMIFMYFTSIRKINEVSIAKVKLTKTKHKFCKYCGSVINQAICCPKCGRSQSSQIHTIKK